MSLFASLGKKLGRLTVGASGAEDEGEGERVQYMEEPYVSASLVTGSLAKVVQLPSVARVSVQGAWADTFANARLEWMAVNTFDFVQLVSELYASAVHGCRHVCKVIT